MRIPHLPIHRSGELASDQQDDWVVAPQTLNDLWDHEGGNIHRQTWPHRLSDDWVTLEGQRGFYWRRLEDPSAPEIAVTDNGYPTGKKVHSITMVAPTEFNLIRAGGRLGITTTHVYPDFYERAGTQQPSTSEIAERVDQCLGGLATRQISGALPRI